MNLLESSQNLKKVKPVAFIINHYYRAFLFVFAALDGFSTLDGLFKVVENDVQSLFQALWSDGVVSTINCFDIIGIDCLSSHCLRQKHFFVGCKTTEKLFSSGHPFSRFNSLQMHNEQIFRSGRGSPTDCPVESNRVSLCSENNFVTLKCLVYQFIQSLKQADLTSRKWGKSVTKKKYSVFENYYSLTIQKRIHSQHSKQRTLFKHW